MNIKQRFTDNLLASTTLNPTLVTGLQAPALKGPIVAEIGLDKVAENVHIDMANMPENASHARPSMFASISSFAENVRKALNAVAPGNPPQNYAGLDTLVKQDFTEWQGMLAAVALSNVYSGSGLDLSVDTVRLVAANNVLHRCILMEMDKEALYKKAIIQRNPITDAPEVGYLFYICQNGKPFALYHPEVGLCAMKRYDSTIFDGVISWHESRSDSCHTGWKTIAEPGKAPLLDDFCLSRIAWWAQENDLRPFKNFLQSLQRDPNHFPADNLKSLELMKNASNIDNVWGGQGTAFGTSMMFCRDAEGNAYSLPELFMDKLFITYVGDQSNNRMVYNSAAGEKEIHFQGKPAALDAFAPVPPFSKSMVKLLRNCTLNEITFDPHLVSTGLKSVSVTVEIMTAMGETFTISKTYESNELCQGKLPHLMVWPFIAMPKGTDLWHDYHATWHDQARAMKPLKDAEGKNIPLIGSLGYDFADQGKTANIFRPTAELQSWYVCSSQTPFQYAILTGRERDGEQAKALGMVFVPKLPDFDLDDPKVFQVSANNPVKLAIDFGTTSTVCALQSTMLAGAQELPLPFKDYSRAITCWDEQAKRTMDIEHWLGNTSGGPGWKWDRKIFSVAQLMERRGGAPGPGHTLLGSAGAQEYYVDGRMFLVSGAALTNYASSASGSDDPLLEQQIMNDMKFNETLDVKNYHAASVYLAGLYTYAVLYLLSEKLIPGTGFLELRVSYPNDVTMNALRNSWNYAGGIVNRMMDSSLTSAISNLLAGGTANFYSEAIATTAYQMAPGGPLAFVNSLVSLDIGGGTTDISITNNLHPGESRTLSVRYAGREIMVSSIIEAFRRFSQGAVNDADASFRELWKQGIRTDPQGTETLLNQFASLCNRDDPNLMPDYLHSLTTNSTMRMDVEMLLADGLDMGSVSDVSGSNLLRQLIALKFLMVMCVTAETVHQNIDMWVNPKTGALSLFDNKLEINLGISGTSAQLLQYVFDCDMVKLPLLQAPVMGQDAESLKMKRCKGLLEIIFMEALKDDLKPGQTVDLKIYVDKNVKEKRDVCFGMLKPSINILAKKGPAAVPAAAPAAVDDDPLNLLRNPAPASKANNMDGMVDEAVRAIRKANMQSELNMYPQEKLAEYIEGKFDAQGNKVRNGLMNYLQAYEQIYFNGFSRVNRGLSNRICAISDLLRKENYMPYFTKSRQAVMLNRAMYMIEDEQKEYIDLLACMYLVDEILDWEMADYQR